MSILAKLFRRDPLPKLDATEPLVIQLAQALRALDALPLSTKEEREAWSSAAAAFKEKLRSSWSPIYDSLPHELEHYLVDDDIRANDPEYVEYQRRKLAVLLAAGRTEPNQTPEPRSGTVTPCAEPALAPDPPMAHFER